MPQVSPRSLSTPDLLSIFNQLSPVAVSRLTDRPAAVRRVERLLSEQGRKVWGTPMSWRIVGAGDRAGWDESAERIRRRLSDMTIRILQGRRTRAGSAAARRREMMRDGMTVQQYIDAVAAAGMGGRKTAVFDVIWDRDRGILRLDQ